MSEQFQAIFEDGVLRPLVPILLNEREVVSISIERVEPSRAAVDGKKMPPAQKHAISALLDRMEKIAETSSPGDFSERDHDRAIYGAK